MRREASHTRAAALIALGAFFVHQLHYLLTSGSQVGEELREQGYTLLGHVPPTLAAFAITILAARLLLIKFGPIKLSLGPTRSPVERCALFAVSIFLVYLAQESLEALLFAQHPEGVLAALSHGWWLTFLLSALLAPLFFMLDRWVGRLEQLVAKGRQPQQPRSGSALPVPPCLIDQRRSLSPLAFGLARRPPPLAL